MIKKLRIFLFGIDDWYLVWNRSGYTKISQRGETVTVGNCYVGIEFSPSRNRYKIRTAGYKPKKHFIYKVAIDNLNHYENQLG